MKTKPNNGSALFTVFLVVLVDLMGFGIVLPLLPFYATQFDASPVLIGLLYSIYSLAQLVFSPIWGRLSDRIGRRPIMLISTFGAGLSYLIFAFSDTLPMLFFSRLLAGVMGGNIGAAQAYVADVTSEENRAKGMGLIGAAFGIGFVIGPAISSLLLLLGDRFAMPGLVAALLSFTSFVLVWFKLPESAPRSAEKDFSRVRKISIFSIHFWRKLFDVKSKLLPMLLLSGLILAVGQSSLYSAFPLFCKKILLLPAKNVGLLFVWMGLVAVILQGLAIRPLVKKFGEKKLFLSGNFLLMLGLLLLPFASSQMAVAGALCVMGAGASLNGPTLISLISKMAHPNEMGLVLGNSQGLSALGRVIGPTWGGWLFSFSPKLPFLLTAAVVFVTILIGFQIQE
jgi:multidrug resistance protein